MIGDLGPFGVTPGGQPTRSWALTAADGLRVVVTDLGASIVSVELPGDTGPMDVVLGYEDAEAYATRRGFLGATVGRCANRIAHGRVLVGGHEVQLSENITGGHLHGGVEGFSKKVFASAVEGDSVTFTHVSPAGDEGYPGRLALSVTYRVRDPHTLAVRYIFEADAATVANPTNHAYLNLAGRDAGSLAGHRVTIHADAVTGTDAEGFGTAELVDVSGTVLDMRRGRSVADVLATDPPLLAATSGYDHNYVVGASDALRPVAHVVHEPSGRSLEVRATAPCVQFYSANHLHVTGAKGGVQYGPRSALCLEPQYAPNAVLLPGLRSSHLPAQSPRTEEIDYVFGW